MANHVYINKKESEAILLFINDLLPNDEAYEISDEQANIIHKLTTIL